MSEVSPYPMTVDEYLVWAEGRPGRSELVGGRAYAMSPERLLHTQVKGSVYVALRDAIARGALPCEALPDGATVRIDGGTAFEPDALVRCGPKLDADLLEVPDAVIVVEVLSPGTRNHDTGAKLIGYFTLPGIRHYLMVDPDRRVVVHHGRDGDAIATRILGAGMMLPLDPPGLTVAIDDLLGRR